MVYNAVLVFVSSKILNYKGRSMKINPRRQNLILLPRFFRQPGNRRLV